ncbi:TetR family transcriptional regulator (plasmid) [Burkholderia sp. SFA1]|uniref:TetR/AcrR family transcriptional regulator n=1 Tax=unclassified Caballeronia TaxID=2646786 RepID=UPI001F245CBA|nr:MULTISPECIES: TetR/AcrR family transcriptional regulator [unclassified Caballeronia]MCE4546204.1 TetR family transcriptional regulator [Caballeronia sp. PC1]MCE4573321.1 TetR family transcriptional regulator [Caballeronia sp. CLC5]BBQ01487.1 TetR family transcriptional regulator [Burkholderia sp. SFA1]
MTKDDTTHVRAHGASGKRKRLGRPAGNINQRENILDAAEVDFSQRGYAGTSLKEVAASCGVTQALITYYFGTKQQLFEQVFLRRALLVSEERVTLLRELTDAKGANVRDIVRAFLLPLVALRGTDGGRAFIRLQARLHTEPPEISYNLRSTAYGDSTDAYVEALRAALPGLPAKDLYWRVTMMIGAYLYAFSDTHRLDVLAKGACDPWDANETLEQLTSFIVGGLEAQACAQPAAAKKAKPKAARTARAA